MCGICGKISHDGRPVDVGLIEKMCATLRTRGPDDHGVYVDSGSRENGGVSVGLGHQRLSIIDLSDAGHQPMCNEDGTVWIAYNGEIYNFKELRTALKKNGHTFKSRTDTEIVLHHYEEKGTGAVEDFNGMFAFALWDEKRKKLWLCRDRIGIKPLVYYWDGQRFAFASEIKALLSDPDVEKELDYHALYLYLAFSYIPAPYTIFKKIRKLPPGNHLTLENGRVSIHKYWDADPSFHPCALNGVRYNNEAKIQRELENALEKAVRSRLISDVPLGAFLSGGIDSSIIVSLMARHASGPVRTFSIGFKDDKLFDETRYARDVAKAFHTEHHEFKITHKDMLDALPEVLNTFDEPFADSSAIPTFIVSRETRKHVTVALSGDGGDELFAGYRYYLGEYWRSGYMRIPSLVRNRIIEPIAERLPESRDSILLEYARRARKFLRGARGTFPERVLALKEIFPGEIRRRIVRTGRHSADDPWEDPALDWVRYLLANGPADPINRLLYADLQDSLPCDMLTKVDWMSMKNSLEVRVPFLDHHVVELAFRIQGTMKIRRGTTKYILKETFKKYLPRSLHRRSKAGFEIPIGRWLRGDLRFLIERYLSADRISRQGIFDPEIVHDLTENMTGKKNDTSWIVWNLIVFQYWYERYF